MNRDMYDLIHFRSRTRFDFFSKGPRGLIWKTIQFKHSAGEIFDLSFGDWSEILQQIDDRSRSNNLDRDKLLNTVAYAVLLFLDQHPGSRVRARGSTAARTRLYQMAINANWAEVNMQLDVSGY